MNVDLPKSVTSTPLGSLSGQNHVFLRSIDPALHIVKIRQILSTSYQNMYYSGREQSFQPLAQIWSLCCKVREWYDTSPGNLPDWLSALYRQEWLYTTIIILSPSHRCPELCDFNKVLLFDHCISYVGQLRQALEDPNALPTITFIDIQRGYQVGRRFVDMLNQDYDLLLSPSIPPHPAVPPGTPEPPSLCSENRLNSHARSMQCLTDIGSVLQYCRRKWDMSSLLEQFEHTSASTRKRLMQTPAVYFNGPGHYVTETSTMLPAVYPSVNMGHR